MIDWPAAAAAAAASDCCMMLQVMTPARVQRMQ